MTQRLKGCTVVFDQDIREDDAEVILNAIRQLRHVADVSGLEVARDDWANRARIRVELQTKFYKFVQDLFK